MRLTPPPTDASALLWVTALYAATLVLTLAWVWRSCTKHGLRKRSLRRYSYYVFVAFLASRVGWCAFRITDQPVHAELCDRLALCLNFLVLSLLVCGWADSTTMMSSARSLQPVAIRPSDLFYNFGPAFIVVNLCQAGLSLGLLLPLAWCPLPRAVSTLRAGDAATGSFLLLLAVSSLAAGLAVSWKISHVASVEPALRSFAQEKMRKVSLTAAVFFTCSLAHALLLAHALVEPRLVRPAQSLGAGVVLTELLPVLTALLALRRAPVSSCCGPRTDVHYTSFFPSAVDSRTSLTAAEAAGSGM